MSFGQGGPSWGPGGGGPQPPQGGQGGWDQQGDQHHQGGWDQQGVPQGPDWGGGSGARTPDWEALAEESEASARRRKLLIAGGGVLATLAVAAVVAVAVVSTSGSNGADKPSDELPATADIPSKAASPEPSFENTTPPPAPEPSDYIASARKDKAPLSAKTLFPADSFTMDGRTYKRGADSSTKDCASVTHGKLGGILTSHHCTRVIRTTFFRDGVGVTVGVAVFDRSSQATDTVEQFSGKNSNIRSLSGSGVPAFCTTARCRSTSNYLGRYAYFTIAGFTSGKDVSQGDTKAYNAGDDLAQYTANRIYQRGKDQAQAAVNGQ